MKRIDFILIILIMFVVLFSAITSNADKFTWNESSGANYYEIAVLDLSTNPDAVLDENTFVYKIPNGSLTEIESTDIIDENNNPVLVNERYYELYIRAGNTCGNTSAWSAPLTWGCFQPSDINLDVIKTPLQININVK